MKISMYAVRVRLVSDVKGPLEDKPRRVVVTIARDHIEAAQHARDHYQDLCAAGVVVEYGEPYQLSDTSVLESLVYA